MQPDNKNTFCADTDVFFEKKIHPALFDQYPVYNGIHGLSYSKQASLFRIWSPTAQEAQLKFYREGTGGVSFKISRLQKGEAGDWYIQLAGDWEKAFYTFRVKINDQWSNEITDPYARAVGVNGRRAMVTGLVETDPPGWANDKSPSFSKDNHWVDAVIYELHVRDAGSDSSSGIFNKGKFAGLTETGTVNKEGLTTGLDHLKELGVTHVQLLPFHDYCSVDESLPGLPQYNWGYDPLNYNVPEGSYSSNAGDGITRINELKQMIAAFHQNGLLVIMDVVYNHTAFTEDSNFNQLVPGYYYRHNPGGGFSNATGCGNEIASEMPMMRKFMLESVLYWMKEYHIDGFRFDLMGVHDIETMNIISAALRAIRPGILLYGEGWAPGDSPMPGSMRAIKKNVPKLDGIAVFSDDIRDGIRGSVFDVKAKGFVSGNASCTESVKFGIVASCRHDQVDCEKIVYSKTPYATAPGNVITYCECHDNHVLWDKLFLSNPGASIADREMMHRLALTIVLTSQGIPFLHAGTEFMRSKNNVENSYNSGDDVNAIDWHLKTKHIALTNYIKQLICMRKEHPAFRMTSAVQIQNNIRFDEPSPGATIAYTINGAAMYDSWKTIRILLNGTGKRQSFRLPEGNWKNAMAETSTNRNHHHLIDVEKYSAVILYRDE